MKKLLLILLLAVGFASCEKDEVNTFKVDPNAIISLRPATGTKLRSADATHLSALEIVKQTVLVSLRDTRNGVWARSFIPEQRDTVSPTPKLLMWATDVISIDGELQTGFLGNFLQATDVVFVRYLNGDYHNVDTIAYIPNSVLREAETKITAAYSANNIDSCYTLFNSAYSFIPITGEEWRALKALNQQ